MANSRPFATVENAGFTVAPQCSFLDNTLRTIDKAVAIFVIGLLLAVGRWLLRLPGVSSDRKMLPEPLFAPHTGRLKCHETRHEVLSQDEVWSVRLIFAATPIDRGADFI
jgi:hypothetical protein